MSTTPVIKFIGILPWGLFMKMLRADLKFQTGMEEEIKGSKILVKDLRNHSPVTNIP